jgi:hypothetical protein
MKTGKLRSFVKKTNFYAVHKPNALHSYSNYIVLLTSKTFNFSANAIVEIDEMSLQQQQSHPVSDMYISYLAL